MRLIMAMMAVCCMAREDFICEKVDEWAGKHKELPERVVGQL